MTTEPGRTFRTRVSALLLAAGTVAFVLSLALPAVTRTGLWGPTDARRATLDGWSCALNHGPTAGTNWFLASAFAVWGAAVWWRSVWAWWGGAVASAVGLLVHGFVGAWPGYERIVRLHAGYWTWLAATAAVCASFLLLPRPVRPPPGEPLPVEDRDRGRAGIAAILGIAATAAVVASFLVVPTVVSSELVRGEPPEDADPDWYQVGPTRSSHVTQTVRVTNADGTVADAVHHYRSEFGPVVSAQVREPGSAVHAIGSLLMPALFLAAATTRRRVWRWSGAVLAASATTASVFWIDTPWPYSGLSPHPLVVLWIATPAAFVPAFLLLPPRRDGA